MPIRYIDLRARLRHRVAFRRLRLSIDRKATNRDVIEMICDKLVFEGDRWSLSLDTHTDDHQIQASIHIAASITYERAIALARLRECLRADGQTVGQRPVTTPSQTIQWVLERVAQHTEEFSC